jgi:phytoene dehydrogenase-like protein
MSTLAMASGGVESADDSGFDAIVIGAGVAGLYQLYRLRELGLRVRAFEAGSGVGGTWYWNRYPGARFDSESWTYGYSFSQELLDEWDWQEHFAPQPETEQYLNYVADKFDLRRDIQFDSRVAAARYREDSRSWEIALEDGRLYPTRFLSTAIGILSAPTASAPPVSSDYSQKVHRSPPRMCEKKRSIGSLRNLGTATGSLASDLTFRTGNGLPRLSPKQCGHSENSTGWSTAPASGELATYWIPVPTFGGRCCRSISKARSTCARLSPTL